MKRSICWAICAAICAAPAAPPAATPSGGTPAAPSKIENDVDAYLRAATGSERVSALETIEKTGPAGVRAMIGRLRSELLRREPRPDAVVRLDHAFIKLGRPSLPPIVAVMRNPGEKPVVRAEAARIIAQIQGQRSLFALVEVLVDALAAHPAPLAARLIEILGDMNDPRPIPAFEQAMRHDDASVRFAAATALGKLAHPEVIPSLIRALDDRDLAVRSAANRALIRLSGVDQGFEPDAPAADRAAVAARWSRWWAQRKGT